MKLTKGGTTYDLTNPDQIKAFKAAGWIEVEDQAEEPKKAAAKKAKKA